MSSLEVSDSLQINETFGQLVRIRYIYTTCKWYSARADQLTIVRCTGLFVVLLLSTDTCTVHLQIYMQIVFGTRRPIYDFMLHRIICCSVSSIRLKCSNLQEKLTKNSKFMNFHQECCCCLHFLFFVFVGYDLRLVCCCNCNGCKWNKSYAPLTTKSNGDVVSQFGKCCENIYFHVSSFGCSGYLAN